MNIDNINGSIYQRILLRTGGRFIQWGGRLTIKRRKNYYYGVLIVGSTSKRGKIVWSFVKYIIEEK